MRTKTPETHNEESKSPHILEDSTLRRIVIVSTALAFAGTAAACASFRMDGRMFVWHWTVGLWMLVGAVAAVYFWKFALRAQAEPTAQNKRNAIVCGAIVTLLAVFGVFWPMRFVAQARFGDLGKGLLTAAAFLGVGAGVAVAFVRMLATDGNAASQPKIISHD